MNQDSLFYDDINEALRAVVQALHGMKAVGGKLWPEKPADVAGRLLADCLNAAKAEKLSPDQVLLLLRWGRDAGCHAAMAYLAAEAGYEPPKPMLPADQRDRLADAILESARTLERALKAAERIERPSPKAVA